MKRIMSLIFIFILSVVMVGCKPKAPKITESSELKFDVEVNYEDVCFIMTYDFGEEKNNFVETGFIYAINYDGEEKLTFETEGHHFRLIDIEKEDKRCTISIISTGEARNNEYVYTFRGYIKRSNGDIIYSEEQEIVTVDANKIIFTLDIKINMKDYTLLSVNHDVTVKITNTSDFAYINLEVTPMKNQIFFNYIEVAVNDKEVDAKNFKIEDGKLYIKITDPNWTDIY